MKKNNVRNLSLFYLFFVYFYQIDTIPIILGMNLNQVLNESLLFLIPVIFVVFNIMKDEEKMPVWIKKISIVSLAILLVDQTYNYFEYTMELFSIVTEDITIKLIPLIIALLIMNLINRKQIDQKITIPVVKINTYILVILSLIVIWLQLSFGNINYNLITEKNNSINFIINFMPIIYLMYLDVKEGEFEKSFLSTICISLILLALIYFTYQTNIQSNQLMQLGYLDITKLSKIILFLNFTINYSIIILTYNFVSREIKPRNKDKVKIVMLCISILVIYIVKKNISIIINIDVYTLVIHLIFGLTIVMYGFFIGMKKYNNSIRRLFLFLLPSFVLLYLVYLFSLIHNIYGETIFIVENINYMFLIFSIFVIIYYTLETLLLFYAYDKQKYCSEEPEIVIQKKYNMYVMIPCLNEEIVIENTISSILSSDYENLSVYAIDDASDDRTAEIISSFTDPRVSLISRVKPNAQEGKGEALNYVFEMIKEDVREKQIPFEDVLIAIIDADTFVYPDYFHKINYVFNVNPEVTGLQSKVRVISKTNDKSQDLEFTEIINATQSLRMMTNTVAFGGNGQFCKLSTLDDLNEKPWSNSLVEDFDLSTRLFLAENVESINIQYSDIFIEQTGIDKDLRALVKQRVRWAQGNVQSSKYIKQIIKSKNLEFRQKYELLMTLIKPWLMAIEYVIVAYTVVAIIDGIILFGVTEGIKSLVVIFGLMTIYILSINLIWAILYNRSKETNKKKLISIFYDWMYLTKFLLSLTQIYPQSLIRYFKAENGWDKTKRQG